MTPEPRARARRRKLSTPVRDAAETTAPVEEPSLAEHQPAPEQPPDADPTIIDTTATILSEEIEPLEPAPEPESQRTDFYFPPLPRSAQRGERPASPAGRARQRTRQTHTAPHAQAATRQVFRVLRGLARTIQILVVFAAKRARRATLPPLRAVWRWMVVDPYAPPRERPEQAILQGRVLGVYRYRLYQRLLLTLLGGIPLVVALLYIAYLLINSALYGVDGLLFLVQDLAGAFTGLFSSLMLLNLASTRITLHGDGIEYKTLFRVVRSRWDEISMLKVDYFRRSERWVVGTGRGAFAFLHRSLLGLPKGRQLAKLITIYARLRSTGTPYWLPSLGRAVEGRTSNQQEQEPKTPVSTSAPSPEEGHPDTRRATRKTRTSVQAEAQQPAP